MKTRITKSLLDSWGYMFDCAEGYEQEAREEFLSTLNREQLPPNEAQQAGLDFEKLVMRIAQGEDVSSIEKGYAGAKKVAEIVKGGQWQVHVDTDVTVDGRVFWLHGFCDVIKAGVIYDVKYKTKSFASLDLWHSYSHSSQHSAYLRCVPEAYKFVYLISDGTDLYTEEYTPKTAEPIENVIRNFMNWLKAEPELLQIYEEKWVCDG